QTVGHAGHSGTAIAVQAGAEKSQLAQLRNQMHRESGFAAVLFDNRNNFVFDEFARGLPDEFFLVIELRIKIDEIHSGISGHVWLPNFRKIVSNILSRISLAPPAGDLRALALGAVSV